MTPSSSLLPAWFVAGGPVMWPILVGSLLTLAVLLEKLVTLRRRAVLQPEVARTVRALTRAGQLDEAGRHCEENPGPYASIAAAALEAAPWGPEEVRQSVRDAGRQEGARLERYLPVVRTVAAIAPLLGLLGTVLGMIEVFSAVESGGLGEAEELSGGIQEALLTTAFGLSVAIPSFVVHAGVHARVERLLLTMEREVIALVSTLVRRSEPSRVDGAVAGREAR